MRRGGGSAAMRKWFAAMRPDTSVLLMFDHTNDAMMTVDLLEARYAFRQKPSTFDQFSRKIQSILPLRNAATSN
jgi:DNA-binding NtrC family response regulator